MPLREAAVLGLAARRVRCVYVLLELKPFCGVCNAAGNTCGVEAQHASFGERVTREEHCTLCAHPAARSIRAACRDRSVALRPRYAWQKAPNHNRHRIPKASTRP